MHPQSSCFKSAYQAVLVTATADGLATQGDRAAP